MSDLKEVADRMLRGDATEFSKEVDILFDAVNDSIEKSVIPEEIFKEVFLDHFKNVSENDFNSVTALQWINIAGGPYKEVDVVDSNNNVLFTAPALYSRPIVDESVMQNVNMNNILVNYNMKVNRLVVDGENYINRELSGMSSAVGAAKEINVAKWNNLIKRYYGDSDSVTTDTSDEYGNDGTLELDYD